MLILLEPNLKIRKKLCDILAKERILGVDTLTEAIEKLCHFRSEIDVIIAHINFFVTIVQKNIVHKICDKISVKSPPVAGYFLKGEEEIMNSLPGDITKMPIIEYDETDRNFPFKFISMIKELYPQLNFDIKKANETWQGEITKPVEYIDPRKWLEEEGFAEVIHKKEEKERTLENAISGLIELAEQMTKPKEKEEGIDYKKLYFELKEKYEELLRCVEELRSIIGK